MFSGDFGSYQLRQFLLHLMSAFTAGLHMMVLVTVAAIPDYEYSILYNIILLYLVEKNIFIMLYRFFLSIKLFINKYTNKV